MADKFKLSVNDLSGAVTLPLISKLFAEWKSVDQLEILLRMLTAYFHRGHTSEVFDMVCALLQSSGFCLPPEFYDVIKTNIDKREFIGEFLTDFREILGELSE